MLLKKKAAFFVVYNCTYLPQETPSPERNFQIMCKVIFIKKQKRWSFVKSHLPEGRPRPPLPGVVVRRTSLLTYFPSGRGGALMLSAKRTSSRVRARDDGVDAGSDYGFTRKYGVGT